MICAKAVLSTDCDGACAALPLVIAVVDGMDGVNSVYIKWYA